MPNMVRAISCSSSGNVTGESLGAGHENSNFEEACILISLSHDQCNFDLDGLLLKREIPHSKILFAVERQYRKCVDLVVAKSNLSWILEKLSGFSVETPYHPALPTDGEICIYGVRMAKSKALADFFTNAQKARLITRASGPVQCYRNAARDIGLLSALERRFFSLDLQVNYSYP